MRRYSSNNLSERWRPGEQVVAFTGKHCQTVAHHGIVAFPGKWNDRYLIFFPGSDRFGWVDDQALLPCQGNQGSRATFAQIAFMDNEWDGFRGTYRRLLGTPCRFVISVSKDGRFGFQFSATIGKLHLRKVTLSIQVPSQTKLNQKSCLRLLREILSVNYVTTSRPKSMMDWQVDWMTPLRD